MIQIVAAISEWHTGKHVPHSGHITLLHPYWAKKVKEFEVELTTYKNRRPESWQHFLTRLKSHHCIDDIALEDGLSCPIILPVPV